MESKSSKCTSIRYHDIFDYKLTKSELIKWQYKQGLPSFEGKNQKSKRQLQREKYSKKKLVIAKKAAKLISKIPTVKFVGITGALAMMNADRDSDIDLLIITRINTLWTTRLLVYLFICLFRIQIRKPRNKQQKDRLCLNMWMDESDLIWDKKDRNIYTAHEIAQIVPLINKEKIYEKFIYLNRWVLNYWPNAVAISSKQQVVSRKRKDILHATCYMLQRFFEYLAYKIQYWYMFRKITREVITKTRAIFHPNDWGKVVIKKLSS